MATRDSILKSLESENRLNLESARGIAEEYLQEQSVKSNGRQYAIFEDEIIETPFAWIFLYNSSVYLQTLQREDMLIGCAPPFVSKSSGRIHLFSTAHSIDSSIKLYEQKFILAHLEVERLDELDTKQLNGIRRIIDIELETLLALRKDGSPHVLQGELDEMLELHLRLESIGVHSTIRAERRD